MEVEMEDAVVERGGHFGGLTFGTFLFDALMIFLFVVWFWLLIRVVMDLFRRSDMSGLSKVLWVIALLVVPYIGIFAYLVTRSLKPATLIALVLAGLIVLPALPSSYWDRVESIFNEDKDATGSRDERRRLMEQAWQIFLENPVLGIGAGQFQNYGDPGLAARWRVTHNALLQVAAELGVFALVTFGFLIVRAFGAAWWTRKHLSWIYSRGRVTYEEDGLDADERRFLQTTGAALIAALAGWFVCAMFASVAFNWTFYYLLGLAVTSRDIVRARARAYAQARQLAREAGPRVVAA
jgi:O-antigen ligase